MNSNEENSSKKRKCGFNALALVLRHQEDSELEKLRKEVKRLHTIEAIQVKTAVADDIFIGSIRSTIQTIPLQ